MQGHHEQLETLTRYDAGRELFVWRCTCGAKGNGTADPREAVRGWRRHAGFRRRPTRGTIRSSRDW